MSFSKFVGLLGIMAVLSPTITMAGERSAGTTEGKLNFVVILADDLGWSDLGCYGADLHETPNLDKLASQGVRFSNAYAASVCSPTRACLLTGKHYARLQTTIWREGSLNPPRDRKLLPPPAVSDLAHAEVTLAEVFRTAGYLTAIVGKWHLGSAPHYPETQGFDINIGGTLWGAPHSYFFPYRGQGRFGEEFRYVPHLENGASGEYLTDRLTTEALHVIDQAKDRPFFLYLAHYAPHTPLEAPAASIARYEAKLRPGLRHRNAKYAAMVEGVDRSVGRILERLDERGLANRTVVIFLSDNGGQIGTFEGAQVTDNFPLRSGKGSLYEGGVRIPLIVRWPGVTPPNQVCAAPVYVADIYPTLLDAAGLRGDDAHNAKLDGVDIVPLLKDSGMGLARKELFFHYPHYYPTTTPVSAIRSGDWKLLEYFEDGRTELYDLKTDLGESRDLAAMQPERATELRSRLEQWRKEIGAGLPTKNPRFAPAPQ